MSLVDQNQPFAWLDAARSLNVDAASGEAVDEIKRSVQAGDARGASRNTAALKRKGIWAWMKAKDS